MRKAPNWGRLVCGCGGATRGVLLLAESVTGLLWPPLVAEREVQAAPWQHLFERARPAGLDWERRRGVTRAGAQGRRAFLGQTLAWVQHQRCVWHLWRNLAGQLAHETAQAAATTVGDVADALREPVRAALVALDLQQPQWPAIVQEAPDYFRTNQERMRYAYFRSQGYPIGSGTVESAANTVVHHRLRRPGRGWARTNGQAMLAGLSELHSGRFEYAWLRLSKN